uniref:Glycosyltransferase family 92 protein n=1 Tax=Globodera pallida TaxID=36090 RepID=A0A183CC12_GLOPA
MLVLIHLDFQPPFFEPTYEQEDNALPDESQLHKAFVDGVESLEYMYSSQLGKAKVSELVERPGIVEELRKCYGTEPKRMANTRQWTKNGQIYVYSAYLDERTNSIFPGMPSVQVLSSSFGTLTLQYAYYCHFRHYISPFDDDKRWAWDGTNNVESLVLISRNSFCVKSEEGVGIANFTKITKPAKSCSIITDQSVFGIRPDRIKIAVCTKGLDFLEESAAFSARKIVEWVLLQRALGANAVTLYFYWIPSNVRNALQRMADRKQLEIVELNLPANSPNQPFIRHQFIQRNRQQKRRHELIPYNDCFNRYSATHHFVLIADIDEVVVPLRHQRWQQLLHELLARGKWRAEPSSISVRNVFKFWHNKNSSGQNANNNNDNIDSLFGLRWRSDTAQESGRYGKSFHTEHCQRVQPFRLASTACKRVQHAARQRRGALKLHWRQQCPEEELGIEKCQQLSTNVIRDHLLDRFRNEVEEEVDQIESGRYGKSFVNTRSIASVFNHFGLHRLHANVSNTLHVSEDDALKLHWRQQCPEEELRH